MPERKRFFFSIDVFPYIEGFFLLLTNLAQVIKNKKCALIRKEDQVGLIPVEITVDGVVVAWSVESEGEVSVFDIPLNFF